MGESSFPSGYRPANPFNHRTPHFGSGYPVQLPVFEGPLDLLLFLIEREELDINEVSLVAVTDAYLRTIEQWDEIEPGALADFLVVASRLLYIKSSRLLPRPPTGDEDEEGSPDALIRHLLEYRQFKRIADALRAWEDSGRKAFGRSATPADLSGLNAKPPDLSAVDLPLLQKALQRALARIPDEAPPPKVHAYTVTVAERIEAVRTMLRDGDSGPAATVQPRIAFSALVADCRSRLEIVVTFLAVLELMKQHEVGAVQDETFGEIYLVPDTPPERSGDMTDEDMTDEDMTDEDAAGQGLSAEDTQN